MTRKEYNHCVQNLSDRLYGFAIKNMRDRDDAKDIVQESFERLWRKYTEVEYEKAKSYLFSTAYHCIIDNHRKVKRMAVHQDQLEEVTSMQSDIENKQWIEEGLGRMTDQERSLIMLRDYEGYSYEELKELTGLSLSQVKVYLFRARKKFRDWLIELNKINNVI